MFCCEQNYIVGILLLPLIIMGLQLAYSKQPRFRDAISIITSGITFFLSSAFLLNFSDETTSVELFSLGHNLSITLKLDGLGSIFLFVASFLWFLTTIYSVGYMRKLKEHQQTRFYNFFCLAIFATFGVLFSGNLLTLYLFYEILSFSTYPLVTHHQNNESKQSGRKYLAYIIGPSLCFTLPAMIIIYLLNGNLDFDQGFLVSNVQNSSGVALYLLMLFGFSKAALIPLHSWLPAAMVAPTPVSSLLHAVAVVKVGVFSILRITNDVFGIDYLKTLQVFDVSFSTILCSIVAISILYPSFVALSQNSLKRRLAFSTIGQLAYITMGAVLLTELSLATSAVHIAMHAFSKITLFFCVGAIYVAHHKKYLNEISGLAYKMPITFSAFAIGSLGVVGLPIAGGFITKWNYLISSLSSENSWVAIVFILSSLLSAFYLFEVVLVGLKNKPKEKVQMKEAPLLCLIPIVITAIMTILLFFISTDLYNFAFMWVN